MLQYTEHALNGFGECSNTRNALDAISRWVQGGDPLIKDVVYAAATEAMLPAGKSKNLQGWRHEWPCESDRRHLGRLYSATMARDMANTSMSLGY